MVTLAQRLVPPWQGFLQRQRRVRVRGAGCGNLPGARRQLCRRCRRKWRRLALRADVKQPTYGRIYDHGYKHERTGLRAFEQLTSQQCIEAKHKRVAASAWAMGTRTGAQPCAAHSSPAQFYSRRIRLGAGSADGRSCPSSEPTACRAAALSWPPPAPP